PARWCRAVARTLSAVPPRSITGPRRCAVVHRRGPHSRLGPATSLGHRVPSQGYGLPAETPAPPRARRPPTARPHTARWVTLVTFRDRCAGRLQCPSPFRYRSPRLSNKTITGTAPVTTRGNEGLD